MIPKVRRNGDESFGQVTINYLTDPDTDESWSLMIARNFDYKADGSEVTEDEIEMTFEKILNTGEEGKEIEEHRFSFSVCQAMMLKHALAAFIEESKYSVK